MHVIYCIEQTVNNGDSLSSSGVVKAALLQQLSQAEPTPMTARNFAFGAEQIDKALKNNLPVAALHEVQARTDMDHASAAAYTLLLAIRAADDDSPILWIVEKRSSTGQGRLYPLGLVGMGVSPDRIIYAETADSLMALRIAADTRRSKAFGAVILSLAGQRPRGLDLTATRRLALFARETGQPIFLLRDGNSSLATSAWSRWDIASAASHALEANAPGNPVFDVKLTRHRGGKEGLRALLEWNRETRKFAAYTRSIPAISVFREDFAEERKRA